MVDLHDTCATYLRELWEGWRPQRAALAGDAGSCLGHSGAEGTGWPHARRDGPALGHGPPRYSPAPQAARCCSLSVGRAAQQLTNNRLDTPGAMHLQAAQRMAKCSWKVVCNCVKNADFVTNREGKKSLREG